MLDTIGQNVRKLRNAKSWTQEQLADIAKVTARTVQRIEAGEVPPSAETLLALAGAFDVTVDDLRRTPEEQARLEAEAVDALKKIEERYVVVRLERMERASNLTPMLGTDAMLCEHVPLSSDAEEDAVAEFEGCLHDCLDGWSESGPSLRRDVERDLQRMVEKLHECGFVIAAGHHSRRLGHRGRPDTLITINTLYVMTSRANEPKIFIVYDKKAPVDFQ